MGHATHEHNGPPPPAVTQELCEWAMALQYEDVPVEVRERAKHLLIDAVACGIVGSHVPWSAEAKHAVDAFEGKGNCSLIGWEDSYTPLASALLNGSFIQATELDDYHSVAPLHSGSIILPAILAGAQSISPSTPTSGKDFVLSAIVGFEAGPRIGMALHGGEMLSKGWHSGPVFGSPTAALSAAKLFGLSAHDAESAMGIACTQAGGLMAAQYDGMVKRMQHAFAARNGLLASLLARGGYKGFTKVLERPYGGFLSMFSLGTKNERQYMVEEVVKDLGSFWHTNEIRIKLHACVGACHGLIECLAKMQAKYPEVLSREASAWDKIERIEVGLSMPALQHDGWAPDVRPLTPTGAQMCAAYIAATQLIDGQVLLAQFATSKLDRNDVWALVPKIHCVHAPEFDKPNHGCGARVTVTYRPTSATSSPGSSPQAEPVRESLNIVEVVQKPKGFDPPVSNEEIREKFMRLTEDVIGKERALELLDLLVKFDEEEGAVDKLAKLMSVKVENVLA